MKFRKLAATSALLIAAVGITTGTAYAQPEAVANPNINWTANVVDNSVVLDTDAGSLTTEGDQLQVRDNLNNVVAGFPLSYLKDGLRFPIAAQVDGNKATLTPSVDPATAHPAPMLHDVANQEEMDDAMSSAATQFGLATSVGTLVGTVIGMGGGCVLGGILGAPFLGVGGPIFGCLAGMAAGAPLGAAAGMIVVGGVAGVLVAIQYFNRINAPSVP